MGILTYTRRIYNKSLLILNYTYHVWFINNQYRVGPPCASITAASLDGMLRINAHKSRNRILFHSWRRASRNCVLIRAYHRNLVGIIPIIVGWHNFWGQYISKTIEAVVTKFGQMLENIVL